MVSLVDSVLNHMGKPGFFHLLVTVLLCCNVFPIAFHHLIMIFYGASIPHNCRLPEGWPWHKKFSIPKVIVNGLHRFDQCQMFVDPNSAKLGTKPCVYGWEFYPQGREWTIVAEWGLVCEREYLISLASVVYHGGVLFGGIVCGTLADKFGRKPVMLFTLYVQTAISIGFYFVQNFIVFVILRFIHGFLLQGLYCTTLCLVMELLPIRYRTAAGMGCSVVWSLAIVALSLVSYSVQHWRYIQLSVSLPCIVTFLYIWLIPESVRWLVTIMKSTNAVAAAQKFAQFNKKVLDENFSKDVEMATKYIASSTGHNSESYGMKELLQGPKLRKCSLVLFFCWFSTSCLYHSVSFLLLEAASNRYVSVATMGVVDLVAFVVMYFLLVRFGRKKPICSLLVLGGAICISTVIAENLEKNDSSMEMYVVSTVLALIERSCSAACLAGLTICAAEVFPTVIRAFGIGIGLFFGEIGWILAPEIVKLSRVSFKSVPWIVLGGLAMISGFLILLLPETLKKPLPDSLDDIEDLESRKKVVQTADRSNGEGSPGGGGENGGNINAVVNADENVYKSPYDESVQNKENPENKWYNRNYSRKSATVVRFYGLDGQHEDPCQEVKENKKERIRMVRFSFENEEFRLDPRSPMGVRRISVIREEPELEYGFEEETEFEGDEMAVNNEIKLPILGVESNGQLTASVNFAFVPDPTKPVEKRSRFLVQRIAEPNDVPTNKLNCDLDGVPKVVSPESNQKTNITERPKSRFIVQKVDEDSINLQMLNNNNNNNNNNEKCLNSTVIGCKSGEQTVKVNRFLVTVVKDESIDKPSSISNSVEIAQVS
ncbi:hypothetical protein CHUAL_013704 [Chamberlinius hualienensis]